jgi:hypothetical protein
VGSMSYTRDRAGANYTALTHIIEFRIGASSGNLVT